jgi:RHS repeat-associated protein
VSGNRTQLKTAKQEINYSYDELNRLAEVVTTANATTLGWGVGQKASYQYDEVGNRKGMTNPNGTVVSYGFDVRNRLKTLVHKASVAATAATLLSLSYTVDASGLRTQIAESRPGVTRTTDYTYDQVKRLTSEVVSGTGSQNRSSQWTYDRVGNRLTQSNSGTINSSATYTYDSNDRLQSESGFTYAYDSNGNLVSKKQGTTTLASYRWDEENRMVGATIGAKVISYAYDPNGIRRAQEEVEGAIRKRTEYLVDPNQSYAQVLEEWGASGTASGSLLDESLAKTYIFGDDLISQTQVALGGAATNSFYHYDGLGTTRALSDSAGVVTDRNSYTAFGENDPGDTSGSTDNNFKYTGEQLDPNLGFYYLRARYMSPTTGALVSQDSYMGKADRPLTLNKLIYANDNPVSFTDPSGKFSLLEVSISFSIGFSSGVVFSNYLAQNFLNGPIVLDYSRFKVPQPYSRSRVMSQVERTVRSAYAPFPVKFENSYRTGAHSVIFQPDVGLSGDFGYAIFNVSRVFVDAILEDAETYFVDVQINPHLTDEELGVAIGNVANHELGHTYGLGHTAGGDTCKDDIMSSPSTICNSAKPWHPTSHAQLVARFK